MDMPRKGESAEVGRKFSNGRGRIEPRSRGGAEGANDKQAVQPPLGMLDAVGGKVGKPLAIGDVAELVNAVRQGEAHLPPSVASGLHGNASDLPGVEGADEADAFDAATEETEFGLAGWEEVDHGRFGLNCADVEMIGRERGLVSNEGTEGTEGQRERCSSRP